jgi:divalent metal cation (Fe/Co/Zn/Cd) transporter
MNKTLSLGILIVGIILLIYGISASESLGSEFSRLFTGKPTDKTVWLLLGGIIATAIGASGLLRSSKS